MKKADRSAIVLLVDDDEDDRFFVELALREVTGECQVLSASDGQQALELLTQLPTQPDLVLLDVNMPTMNGFELLRQLRQGLSYQHLPVVMLTTSEAEADRQLAQQLGATDFVTKPTAYEDLTKVVRRLGEAWLRPDPPQDA